MDLTLLESTQLHTRNVQSRRTNAEAAGGCYEHPLEVTGGADNYWSVSGTFRAIQSDTINILELNYSGITFP